MSSPRGLIIHAALLGVAVAASVAVWTKDEAPAKTSPSQVEVWGGRAADVKKVELESQKRTLSLEAHKDDRGPYFVAKVTKESVPRKPAGDGGAPPPPAKRETTTFVAVEAGSKLAEQLAPLKAMRRVGKIEDDRKEEFGFHEPEGTVKISIGPTEYELLIGGTTPGGGHRYVKASKSGLVYVIDGSTIRDILTAETRLIERKLWGFDADEVTRAVVTVGETTRELLKKGGEQSGVWADPAAPDKQDETASNWMARVERLRVTEYMEDSSGGTSVGDPVVSIEYFAGKKSLEVVQVEKLPPGDSKQEYAARSGYTRWYAKVTRSVAEQVAQDVESVVK